MFHGARWFIALLAGSLLTLSCGDFGQVEQGLAISYSPEAGRVTLITDSDPSKPSYDVLPPKVVSTPPNASAMGPAPDTGKLIELDTSAGQLVVYDEAAGELRSISFTLVEETSDVYPDDPRVTTANLPAVDTANGTVTFYSPHTRQLVTVKPPPEALSLPGECWKAGDVIRYYYREPGQALRMMNVTKTELSS